jgi:SAM-dependent methyltransferase
MMSCRSCGNSVAQSFLSLGPSPLANSYVKSEEASRAEMFFSLDLYHCPSCHLVQVPMYEHAENIFSDYAYFSSFSKSWLEHCARFVDRISVDRQLNADSFVVEIASNDGYLLQNFVRKNIPVLGIEPAANVAEVARKNGVKTEVCFFGKNTARDIATSHRKADLIIGNNVLAHVPDVHDFVGGVTELLKPEGLCVFEFPHLQNLVELNQFDTVYHEHFSYFSLLAVERIFQSNNLKVVDVEKLPTHGGSLRVHVAHSNSVQKVSPRVSALLEEERGKGFDKAETYFEFGKRVVALKRRILSFLIEQKDAGKTIVGYGAPAKGNTLLNYCGLRTDFLDYTVDLSPYKQGRLLPGSRIPIFSPEKIRETKPDFIFILPWNLREEIVSQMKDVREWGGKFVTAIPGIEVF